MPMNKSLLITRPNHEIVTKYFSVWSKDVINFAEGKGMRIYDLLGDKATRSNFESYVSSNNPELIFLNGHGSTIELTGQNNEVILDQKSELNKAIVYARSCDVGRILGHELVSKSVKAFIGYERKFILGYSPEKIMRPEEDNIAKLFLQPSNLIVTTIIKGHTVKEADTRSKIEMHKNFRRMLSSASTYEERFAARWLWSNINSQVLLGDPNAKI